MKHSLTPAIASAPPMRRTFIRRIAIAVVCGVATTVLVAWIGDTLALGTPRRSTVPATVWPIAVPPEWPQQPERLDQFDSLNVTTRMVHSGEDAVLRSLADPNYPSLFSVSEDRLGWPMRALVMYEDWTEAHATLTPIDLGPWRAGLTTPYRLGLRSLDGTSRLPLMPLWPGFAINTLFYGTFVYGTMAGLAVLKRRRRFKRGLCIRCAYPLTRGTVCPECGMTVKASARQGVNAMDRGSMSASAAPLAADPPRAL
jgi:hypothetical protein